MAVAGDGRALASGGEGREQAAQKPAAAATGPAKTLVAVWDSANVAGKHFAFGLAEAKCRAGYSVLSGGAQVTGSATLQVAQSYPIADEWVVVGVQPNFFFGSPTPTPGKITAYAICSKAGRVVVAGAPSPATATTIITKKTLPIPPVWGARVSQSATCPDGYGVLSGGGEIENTSYPYITKSDPVFAPFSGWEVDAQQPPLGTGVTTPEGGRLHVYALCARLKTAVVVKGSGPAVRLRTAQYKWDVDFFPLPKGSYKVAKGGVKCGAGWQVISGGAFITGSDYAHLAQSYPNLDDNAWEGAAVQPRFGAAPAPAARLTVTAICAKRGYGLVPQG